MFTCAGNSIVVSEANQSILDTQLSRFQVFEIDLEALSKAMSSEEHVVFKFGDRQFDCMLSLFDVRARGYQALVTSENGTTEMPSEPANTFRGSLVGEANSQVCLLIHANMFMGHILTQGAYVLLEPLQRFVPGANDNQVIVFDNDAIKPHQMKCGVKPLPSDIQEHPLILEKSSSALKQMIVATDADYDYFKLFGSPEQTNRHIRGVLNSVSAIFIDQVGTVVDVGFQHVFTTDSAPNYPYTTNDADALLEKFTEDWNEKYKPKQQYAVGHLFTGKTLFSKGKEVGGIAYPGTDLLCKKYAYAVSSNNPAIVKVVAHEIGHNCNASHDYAEGCGGNHGTLMCPSIDQVNSHAFSDKNRALMMREINKAHCVTPYSVEGNLLVFWTGTSIDLLFGDLDPDNAFQRLHDLHLPRPLTSPSTLFFDNQLYVFWTSPLYKILWGTASVEATFKVGATFSYPRTPSAPATVVYQDKIWIFWRGISWNILWGEFNGDFELENIRTELYPRTYYAPAVVVFKDLIHLFWTGISHDILHATVDADGTFTVLGSIPQLRAQNNPAVMVVDDKIFLFYRGISNDILYAISDAEGRFDGQHTALPYPRTIGAPAITMFNQRIYLFWTGTSNDILFGTLDPSNPGSKFSVTGSLPGPRTYLGPAVTPWPRSAT